MKYFYTFLLMFPALLLLSQSYNGPESVDFDSNSGLYFISNSSEGRILSYHPASDNLSFFIDNVGSGPHGLEVVGNELFVCSGSRLKAYDITTQEQTVNINLGASFANGITHIGDDVFITDFSGKDIYRYNITSGSFNMYIENLPKTPNGILYDNLQDRLLVVCWGNNAPIYEIEISDSTYNVVTTTSLGNCDGIAMDSNGDFYVSAWSNNAISKFNSDFSGESTVVVPNMSSPADIYYNIESDTLAIPNSANNTVVFIGFTSATSFDCDPSGCVELNDDSGEFSTLEACQASCNATLINENETSNYIFFPNPSKSGDVIEFNKDVTYLEIFDTNGNLLFSKKINNINTIKLPLLNKGLYLLKTNISGEKLLIH